MKQCIFCLWMISALMLKCGGADDGLFGVEVMIDN